MARPLRITLANGWYHVTARGNERKAIFLDPADRGRFLELLEATTQRFHWRIHAYVLMNNHYHFLVQTPEANLSAGMQWLGVSYEEKDLPVSTPKVNQWKWQPSDAEKPQVLPFFTIVWPWSKYPDWDYFKIEIDALHNSVTYFSTIYPRQDPPTKE